MSESAAEFSRALLCCRTGHGEIDREQLRQTIETLYITRQSVIFRYVVTLSRNRSEAEDLTQEAFLRLFDHCAAGRPVDNVVNWLMAVARNLMIDRTRGRRFERGKCEGFWAHIFRTYGDYRPNAEEDAIANHERKEYSRVLSCLTELERNCLALRSQGLQYREIGEQLRMTVWSAAHHTSRAVRKLRQRVSEPKDR